MKKKALIVLSSADKLQLKEPKDTSVSIGFFIVEMGKILNQFKDDYDFTFATPDGNVPTIDINGESLVMYTGNKFLLENVRLTTELKVNFDLETYREKNKEYVDRRERELHLVGELLGKVKVSNPLLKSNKEAIIYRNHILNYMKKLEEKKIMSLKEVIERDRDDNDDFKISDFDFVHMPGGHAPMVDFIDNPYMGELLNRLYMNKIILSLICHSSIALSSAKYRVGEDGKVRKLDAFPYKGAKVSVFGKYEELEVSMGGFYHVPGEKTRLEYYVSDKLKEDGYNVSTTMEFLPKVIWEEEFLLLTGNGPQAIDIQAHKLKEILSYKFRN